MPPPGYATCQPANITTEEPDDIGKDDLNALLYIVVTLLFYSMGIIIGIITYLKREQAEMEEDKMFDMYMQLKREPFNLHKRERVNQMALYLKQLEEQKAAREKIENWRIAEHQQGQNQHTSSCRQHQPPHFPHPHSPCPGCSKDGHFPFRYSSDGAPLAVPENEWAEGGGGTALLCSLTLGVVEPLLTPESTKRVGFPDSANPERRLTSVSMIDTITPQACQIGATNSAFRNSWPGIVSTSDTKLLAFDNVNQKLGNETNEPLLTSSHQEINAAYQKNQEASKQGGNETGQLHNNDVFQNDAELNEEQTDVCDTLPNGTMIPTLSAPHKRSMSLQTPVRKYTKLTRQLSQDNERLSPGLAVHSHHASAYNDKTPSSCSEEPIDEKSESDFHQNIATTEALMAGDLASKDAKYPDGCSSLQHQENQPKVQTPLILSPLSLPRGELFPVASQSESYQPLTLEQLTPTQTPPLPSQQRIQQQSPDEKQPSHPLSLSHPLPPLQPPPPPIPQQHTADVRPKVYHPPTFARSLSTEAPSQDSYGSETQEDVPSRSKRHLHPHFDSWKRGNSQTVDIPDMMRSLNLDTSPKSRSHEKKSVPRNQPAERRGALFSKSLHHKDSIDSPRLSTSGGRRPASFLPRQESVDSYNSRASDMSDSPLLPPSNDSNNALNMSSASSSAGSAVSSPPSSKHHRRIPRLARSQTVDTSKLLNK